MLAITSPGDELNYISVIQDLKDPDGQPLFLNIPIGLKCQKCQSEGKDCKHQLKRLPAWKSESRHDIVRAIYGTNKEAMMREAEGLIVSSRVYLYGKKDVDSLVARERYDFKNPVQLIEIGIDPSGGGAGSSYTIVSKCMEDGRDIVSHKLTALRTWHAPVRRRILSYERADRRRLIGFDATPSSRHHDVEAMVRNHLRFLSEDVRYRDAHKLIFMEANMSYIGADMVAGWCREPQYAPVIIESRDPTPRGRVGIWTGPYEKESYAWLLREIIEQDTLYFARDLIGNKVEETVAKFIEQLRSYRMERLQPADLTFGKFKYAYTGKSGDAQDDLVLACQIAVYWGRRKRENQDFRDWCRMQGIRLN